jgi:hypothetical protein
MIILSALAVVTYLVQFLAYSKFLHMNLGADFLDVIGLPLESESEYQSVEEAQLAVNVI